MFSQVENGDEQMLGIVKFAPESMGLLKMHSRGLNLFLSFLLLGVVGGGTGGHAVLMVSNDAPHELGSQWFPMNDAPNELGSQWFSQSMMLPMN
jgi:hypothetical protein